MLLLNIGSGVNSAETLCVLGRATPDGIGGKLRNTLGRIMHLAWQNSPLSRVSPMLSDNLAVSGVAGKSRSVNEAVVNCILELQEEWMLHATASRKPLQALTATHSEIHVPKHQYLT